MDMNPVASQASVCAVLLSIVRTIENNLFKGKNWIIVYCNKNIEWVHF